MAGTMEGLGKTLWNDDEFNAFVATDNAKNYQNYKKRLEDDYDKNYSFGGNFLNWLGNGFSGGGWSKSDFLKNRGISDDIDAYGKAGYLGNSSMNDLSSYGDEYNKARLAQFDAGQNLFSGIPILGDLLSAPTQVVSAGKDLATSGISKWQNGKRDWLSDLGAAGETALTFAIPGVPKSASTLGRMGRGALTGAGFGATGALKDMGYKNFDLGNLALSTAIGGTVGGALSGMGAVWDKYSKPNMANVPVSDSKALIKYEGPQATAKEYQNALKVLNKNKVDITSPESLNNTFKKASVKLHPDMQGGSEALFKELNNAKNLIYDKDSSKMLQNILKASKGSAKNAASKVSKQSFANKLKTFGSNIPQMGKDLAKTKAGTTVSKLWGTKAGKVGAGLGAGLLLTNLMKGKGNNNGNLSEEDMQELYNYIYGGGQ